MQLPHDAVDARQQLEFIAYLQRLLLEGDFVATYKFALLHALADLCIEGNFDDSYNGSQSLRDEYCFTLDELADKFIQLYWQHSLPFSGSGNEEHLLRQNSGKQAAILSKLSQFRSEGLSSLNQLRRHDNWPNLMAQTKRIITEGPLWRLQKLAGRDECFYYPHVFQKCHGQNSIQLNPGIGYCFRRFHDLVISVVRSHWVQKICDYTGNQGLIGAQGNLNDFLFGSNRQAITQARPLLLEIQKGNCFYCQQTLKEQGEVDHFIPWSRYPNDLGHNFVLAHGKCNNSKRDHLATQAHKERWFEQNIVNHQQDIHQHLSTYFICDATRSQAITGWAYQLAAQNGSSLWHRGKEFLAFNTDEARGQVGSFMGME